MRARTVIVRPGRHYGWWVEGRWVASGTLFMLTWWPTQAMAQAIARWFGGGAEGVESSSSDEK